MYNYENLNGRIIFSDEYLAKLIGYEAMSCYGVVGMKASSNKQRIFNFINRRQDESTGINVSTGKNGGIDVEMHIVVNYGMNIRAIAESITEKIKYSITQKTGIEVENVKIRVDGMVE